MKTEYLTVQPDPENEGEYILQFPEEMMQELGWVEGDVLSWDEQPDGSVRVSKKIEISALI